MQTGRRHSVAAHSTYVRKNNNGNKDDWPQGRKRSSKGVELIQHRQGIEDGGGKRLDAGTQPTGVDLPRGCERSI